MKEHCKIGNCDLKIKYKNKIWLLKKKSNNCHDFENLTKEVKMNYFYYNSVNINFAYFFLASYHLVN